MKTKICFTLTMPNRGSWNDRWSGENDLYAVVRDVHPKLAGRVLAHLSYYYAWSDGWGASVRVSKVDATQSRKIKKQSNGFCGYDWMVDSILTHGKIYADHEVPKQAVVATPICEALDKFTVTGKPATPFP